MSNSSRGRFITIEGIEGVGKSTSMNYLQEYLEQEKIPFLLTREPGGTAIAEEIRAILKHHLEPMAIDAELLLLFAARAQHINQVIKPNLAKGRWVICDRFTDTSYAYQGGGRGVATERIAQLENFVQSDFRPDLVILLVAPVQLALARAKKRGTTDRFESEQEHFFERAQAVYLARAKQFPHQYRIVDANRTPTEVQQQLIDIIKNFHELNS